MNAREAWIRRVLLAVAWLSGVMALGALFALGLTVTGLAAAVYVLLPGVAAVALILTYRVDSRGWWLAAYGLVAWWVLAALGTLAHGDPRGVTGLVVPAALLVLFRRGGHRGPARRADRGEGTVAYIVVLLLVVSITAALVTAGIPNQVGGDTKALVCRVVGQSCPVSAAGAQATPAPKPTPTPANGAGNNGNNGNNDGGGKKGGGGFLSGVGHFFTGVGGAFWDSVTGVGHLITHPGSLIDGLNFAVHHPWTAIKSLVWDSKTAEAAKNGDWGTVVGRLTWNVGSWFIPFVDVGKAAKWLDVVGGLGKVADVAELVEDVGNLANDAEKAADAGDIANAEKDAAKAEQEADQAEQEAQKEGCPVALGLPAVLIQDYGPLGAARLIPMDGGKDCGTAKEAAQKAGQAVKAVLRAKLKNLGLTDEQINAILGAINDTDKGTLQALDKTIDMTSDGAKAAAIKQSLQDLAALLDKNALGKQTVQSVINGLNKASHAGDPANIASAASEIHRALEVVDSGAVAPGTKVAIAATGKAWLGKGAEVTLDPGLEGDVVFKDTGGIVHVEEVKDSMNALISKLRDGTQDAKLAAFAGRPGQAAAFVVTSTADADQIFKYPAELDKLISSGVPLRIGDKVYDTAALTAAKAAGHF